MSGLTVGDALARLEEWDQPSERTKHAEAVAHYAELRWTIPQFMLMDEGARWDLLGEYFIHVEGDGLTDDDARLVERHLLELAEGTDTVKQPGDKWVSPGRLVLTWPDLDLTARAVLFTMAAHGNDKGENIYVSQSTIGDYIGRDRTTVFRAMKRLEKIGAVTRTAEPRQHRPATYRINRGSRVV